MAVGCTHRSVAVGVDTGVLSQVLSVSVGIAVAVIVREGIDRVERILRESVYRRLILRVLLIVSASQEERYTYADGG